MRGQANDECGDCIQLFLERDSAEAMCDVLSDLIAQMTNTEIGEHSSSNFPWHNAKEAAEDFIAARAVTTSGEKHGT